MAGHTEESECLKIRPRKSSNMDTFHEVGMNKTTTMGARKAILILSIMKLPVVLLLLIIFHHQEMIAKE